MIDRDGYQNLMGLQLLQQKIIRHLKAIEEHQRRVSDLVNLRKQKLVKKEDAEKLLQEKVMLSKETEKEMDRVVSLYQRSKDRTSTIQSNMQLEAVEKELHSLYQKKEELEHKLFSLMEESEELTNHIKEWNNFLHGSEESLKEIEAEVEEDVRQEKQKIHHYEKQEQQLLDLLSPQVKSQFLRLDSKYRYHNPLAEVSGQNCSECRMVVTRKDQMEIEAGTHLVFCSGCGRILIPQM